MSAIIMRTAAETALKATQTARTAAKNLENAGNPAYGTGIGLTTATTIPAISTAVLAIQAVLVVPYPTLKSPTSAKIRPEDCVSIISTKIPSIGAAITSAIASGFPPSTKKVVNQLDDLEDFIKEKFIKPLTF
mgnify:CR=1 FL=1